ncbi:MAG: M50 family metallopeptidase [Planctomycetota bacterium]
MAQTTHEAEAPSVCDKCGLHVPRQDLLVRQRRSFATKSRWFCPTCVAVRSQRRETINWVLMLLGVVALIVGGIWIAPELRQYGFSLAGYLAGTVIGIIIHEGAHALVAWAVGHRVWRIELGVGKRWGGFAIGEVHVHLRRLPTMGFVISSPTQPRFSATRTAAVLIAGPLSNVLLAIAAISLGAAFRGLELIPSQVVYGFVMANLIMFAMNIWPREIQGGPLALKTDGAQLLGLARDLGKTHREQLPWMVPSIEIAERIARDEDELALAAYEAAPLDGTEHTTMRINAMVVYTRLGQFSGAHAIGVELLEDDTIGPIARALVLNNTAWAGLLDGQKDRAEVFARYMDFALETLPTNAALLGTRAACAIAMGDIEHGRELLEQSQTHDPDGGFREIYLAWLAAADMRQGHAEQAAENIAAARALAASSREVDAIVKHYITAPG